MGGEPQAQPQRVLIDPKTGKPVINGALPPNRPLPEPMVTPTVGGVRG